MRRTRAWIAMAAALALSACGGTQVQAGKTGAPTASGVTVSPGQSSVPGSAAASVDDPQAAASTPRTRVETITPAPATPVPAAEGLAWLEPATASWDWLLAASRDTVWLTAGDRVHRVQRGRARAVGPGGPFAAAVLASDGALWVRTGESQTGTGDLVRIEGDSATVVARGVFAASLNAGGQGQVWLGQAATDRVVGYGPDGDPLSAGAPEWMEGVCLRSASAEGSLWVTEVLQNEEGDLTGCDAALTWARWDGERWAGVELPLSMDSTYEDPSPRMIDDVVWMARPGDGSSQVLLRFADGQESAFVVSSALVPFWSRASDGGTCGFEFHDQRSYDNDEEPLFIVCFDQSGESARFDVAGLGLTGFSVAPDGSVWVKGNKGVARLPVPVM